MKRVFSGIQPSGDVHIGNYVGAIKRWVDEQDEHDNLICIVDLHAITVPQDPAQLRKRSLSLAKLLIACGIDAKKTTLFKQSDVPAHSELAWILNCITYTGELSRMTQFKDKSQKQGSETSSVGLFDYPVLMAADILLYDTDEVPVGEDQKQHLELTRDLASRFNSKFGQTFKLPEPKIDKTGARVMSLTDPSRKMSKSDPEASYIALLDSKEDLDRKIRKAVTTEAGLKNLVDIYAVFSGQAVKDISSGFEGKNQAFKEALTKLLESKLAEIQANYSALSDSEAEQILVLGAQKASDLATKKLSEVKSKIGLT
jgi:tryptophanyl-tRNA synthetase